MISIELMALFFMASISLALVPGPDNIFVLLQSVLHGRKAGLFVTLGLCTGLLVHTTAVCLGVAVIFQTSVLAFNILKLIGAMYLLYLAWLSFKADSSHLSTKKTVDLSLRKLYYRGIFMNITNPKVAIFFLAFLPQFTDPSKGSIVLQMLLLGALFILATIVVFGSIAYFSGYIKEWLSQSEKAQLILNRIAGTIFIALAFKLMISDNTF